MATICNSFIRRISRSTIKSAIKSKLQSASFDYSTTSSSLHFSLPTRSTSSPIRCFSLSRSPSELGGVQSLLSLHSAVATAKMTSCLSTTSRSCRELSQGCQFEQQRRQQRDRRQHHQLLLGVVVNFVETAARQAEQRRHTHFDEMRILMVWSYESWDEKSR